MVIVVIGYRWTINNPAVNYQVPSVFRHDFYLFFGMKVCGIMVVLIGVYIVFITVVLMCVCVCVCILRTKYLLQF